MKMLPKFFRNRIKAKLIISFLTVILLMLLIFSFFAIYQLRIIHSYEEALDTMILERKISQKISLFIEAYNDLGKNIDTPEKIKSYNLLHDEIEDIFLELDSKIISKESRIVYTGLKNIVKDIMDSCDRGIEDIKKGDLTAYSFYYDEANRKSVYIEENTALLLTKEVEFAQATQEKLRYVHNLSMIFGITSIIFIALGCIVFTFLFSNALVRPLESLLVSVEKVKTGNFDVRSQIYHDDEIGKLGMAFNEMIQTIVDSRAELNKERDNLKKSKHELEKKVIELENTKHAVMNILEDTNEANSELIKTKDALKEKVNQLDEVNKKKDEFISVTAHELKTPLTSIKGFTELLKNEQVINNKEMRNNYFNIIIQDTVRLGNLITDILDLTRFDLGTMRFNMEDVTAGTLVEDVQNLVGLQVEKKGLKFPVISDKNILFNLDRSRIVQVISNLINNSIKYTEKGEIRLEIFRKEKGKVHFRVTDTGVGIPKEAQPRIFERFYQADSSYTRKVGGSGLGLSICKAIVEYHGGKIWFESRKGRTMFEFTLNEKVDKK